MAAVSYGAHNSDRCRPPLFELCCIYLPARNLRPPGTLTPPNHLLDVLPVYNCLPPLRVLPETARPIRRRGSGTRVYPNLSPPSWVEGQANNVPAGRTLEYQPDGLCGRAPYSVRRSLPKIDVNARYNPGASLTTVPSQVAVLPVLRLAIGGTTATNPLSPRHTGNETGLSQVLME